MAPLAMDGREIPRELIAKACEILMGEVAHLIGLLAKVAGYSAGAKGVCIAKLRTLAEKLGCSERTVGRHFAQLKRLGLVEKIDRRMRHSVWVLTELGRAVFAVFKAGGPLVVLSQMSRQVSRHNGDVKTSRINSSRKSCSQRISTRPGRVKRCDPRQYTLPRRGSPLSPGMWEAVASFMDTARSVTWARCKVAHKAFSGLVQHVHRLSEWAPYMRGQAAKGRLLCPEDLVRMAIEDAVKRGKAFGTVEAARAYVWAIVKGCIEQRRLPGERPVRKRRTSMKTTEETFADRLAAAKAKAAQAPSQPDPLVEAFKARAEARTAVRERRRLEAIEAKQREAEAQQLAKEEREAAKAAREAEMTAAAQSHALQLAEIRRSACSF